MISLFQGPRRDMRSHLQRPRVDKKCHLEGTKFRNTMFGHQTTQKVTQQGQNFEKLNVESIDATPFSLFAPSESKEVSQFANK